ncbi:MAG: hypothetical protein RMY34_26300 [Aulosira sp. DedQUE10]|nr:hypothetical protein [Aulosira sp. DedQUE10]
MQLAQLLKRTRLCFNSLYPKKDAIAAPMSSLQDSDRRVHKPKPLTAMTCKQP